MFIFFYLYESAVLYSYFMPVCSIVQAITLRCRGRSDALLHEAEDDWVIINNSEQEKECKKNNLSIE